MAGNIGIEETTSRILERDIWYNLRNSCEQHVKGCAVRNKQKKQYRVATVVSCWIYIRTGSY